VSIYGMFWIITGHLFLLFQFDVVSSVACASLLRMPLSVCVCAVHTNVSDYLTQVLVCAGVCVLSYISLYSYDVHQVSK